jgi:hypothetical protein
MDATAAAMTAEKIRRIATNPDRDFMIALPVTLLDTRGPSVGPLLV